MIQDGTIYQLGYIKKGHLLTVTRDDLVGQYIGHTAPKTKEVLKKAIADVNVSTFVHCKLCCFRIISQNYIVFRFTSDFVNPFLLYYF